MTGTGQPLEPPAVRPPAELVGGALLALVVGLGTGGLAGFLVGAVMVSGADGSDGWAAIGGLIAGAVVATATTVAAYLAALLSAGRRLFPRGRRARPVGSALLGLVGVVGYGALLLAVIRDSSSGWTLLVLCLGAAAVACGPVAFVWWGAPEQRPAAAAILLGLLLGAGVVVVVTNALAASATDQVAERLPLVLFDGETADPAYPGWRRDRFSVQEVAPARSGLTPGGHESVLKYVTPAGVTFLRMHTDAGDCSAPPRAYTCTDAGALPQGRLRRYLPLGYSPAAALPEVYLMVVYPDGSSVSVNLEGGRFAAGQLTEAEGREVLGALRRVDRGRFEERLGAPLELR